MLITDYFKSDRDNTWDFAVQCGVKHGVIRLPETSDFDITQKSHWETVYKKFSDFGITPVAIEPMPNDIHDHIKIGDEYRMFPIMNELDIRTICFNFMAYIGWYRTSNTIKERGNALVTGFDMNDFQPTTDTISEQQLWDNYTYFIKSVIPYAEKNNIKLALHPDDPPVKKLGNVSRIMISYDNINKAVNEIVKSDSLGVTMCQASFYTMGEDLNEIIPKLADKIYLVHFRNVVGNKLKFRETFHDNGSLDMANLIKLYRKCGVNVPVRVDHVPTMAGEKSELAGYDAMGRLFAIGHLKGLLEGTA